jgi:hypothetical protein
MQTFHFFTIVLATLLYTSESFRVTKCENKGDLKLECPAGKTIVVTKKHTFYGRNQPYEQICQYNGKNPNLNCGQDNVKTYSLIVDKCNGEKSCVLKPSNSVFGDTCRGTYKYLQVNYGCKPSVNPTAKPSLRPTNKPTAKPSLRPTNNPTAKPTNPPTSKTTNNKPVKFKSLKNKKCKGKIIKQISGKKIKKCEKLCVKTSKCVAYNIDGSSCYLLSKVKSFNKSSGKNKNTCFIKIDK